MTYAVKHIIAAQRNLNRITPPCYPMPLRLPAGTRVTATHIKAMMDQPWVQPDAPPEALCCIAGWISEDDA